MKKLSTVLFLVILWACQVKVSVKEPYGEYFDHTTFQILQNGMQAYTAKQYLIADSLLTVVISKCRNNLPITMPREANPYFYRGSNDIEIGRYEQALADMSHVAADTTTESEVILVRCEALKALKKYDACIDLCNRLIMLNTASQVYPSGVNAISTKGSSIKLVPIYCIVKSTVVLTLNLLHFWTSC